MANTLTGPVASASAGNRSYGIDDAIELMRKMPVSGGSNSDMIVNVVRTTLESAGVNVGSVLDDGQAKLDRIAKRISDLQGEVGDLEGQVQRCRDRIRDLEADIAETTLVKERLLLAQQSNEGAAGDAKDEDHDDIPDTRVSPIDGLINEE